MSIVGPSRITAPSQAATYAYYDGNWLQSATISVTSTSSMISGANLVGTTLTTIPFATEYPVAGGPWGIVNGPDGNLWFAEATGNAVGQISPNGMGYVPHSCTPCNSPRSLTVGADGNIWIAEFNNPTPKVDTMTTAGTVIRTIAVTQFPTIIISGPDGNIWYSLDASPGGLGKISMSGNVQTYSPSGTDVIRGLAFGADGTLWYVDATGGKIVNVTTSGKVLAQYTVAGITIANRPDGMVLGPDGNMWFVNCNSALLEQITPGGNITPCEFDGRLTA